MSTSQPRIPSFIAQSGPDYDRNQTDAYWDASDGSYEAPFVDAIFSEFSLQSRFPAANSYFEPPPPNELPARPAYSIPGSYGDPGLYVTPPNRGNPADPARVECGLRRVGPRLFFVAFEDATGQVFIGARVTRRLVFIFIVAMMLMLLGLQSINGALDVLLNVIF
jgi:hypothetical protein